MNIQTGTIVGAITATAGGAIVQDNKPQDQVIFPGQVEPVITVIPGKIAVLTAYNAENLGYGQEDRINVFKLLRSAGANPSGKNQCCKSFTKADPQTLARARMCDLYMNNCNTVRTICMPGQYTIEMPDEVVNGGNVDGVTVTLQYIEVPLESQFSCFGNTIFPEFGVVGEIPVDDGFPNL